MSSRGRHSIEIPLGRAVDLVSKIGIEAAAEELGVSRYTLYTLRRRLDVAGFTNRRPVRAGRNKTKFTAEKCDPTAEARAFVEQYKQYIEKIFRKKARKTA